MNHTDFYASNFYGSFFFNSWFYGGGGQPEPTSGAPARTVHESTGSAGGYAVRSEFWSPSRKRKRQLTRAEELVLFGGILT